MTRKLSAWAAGVILVVTLAACGGPAQSPSLGPEQEPPVSVQPAPVAPHVAPTHLRIPSIGVDSTNFIPVGLGSDNELQTPTLQQPKTIGWYKYSPGPGDKPDCTYDQGCPQGTVLNAHINADGVQGVFAKLAQVKAGAKIALGRADGKTAHYTAKKTMIFKKSDFPTHDVYGADGLALITCGPNDLVRSSTGGNYLEQTVVLAALDSIS